MPIVYEESIKNDITSKNTVPCYVLFGEDGFLKKHYTDSLSKLCYDGDAFFNLQRFENDINFQELYDAVTQYPMMADKKCVIVDDFDYEDASKSEMETFVEIISKIGEGCTLIIRFDGIEFDVKKSNRAKRIITACEGVGGKVVCLEHRKPQVLVKMIMSAISKRGCKINDINARYLLENIGDDIYVIQSEIDKLCSFASGKEIDKAMIDFLSIKSVEVSIYDYVKKIFACDVSGALQMLDDMFFKRIEPIIILHTAASAYVDTYRVFAGAKAGVKVNQLAIDFAYKNRAFVLERASLNLRKLDAKRINLSFEALMWADDAIKSFANDPQTILEQLTIKLIYIISKGEAVD